MDLGFGSANQILGTAAASNILRATAAQESAIQDEISKCDSILHDATDTDLEKLREMRLASMKAANAQRSEWLANGHGVYQKELSSGQHSGDVAKSFFEAASKSSRMVVHFHRSTTRSCDAFHSALTVLAPRHPETRFVGINVEGCEDVRGSGSGVGSKFLVERLGITVMPTLLIVKDRKAVHQIRGFDELGGREDFDVRSLACVLVGHGAITRRDDDDEETMIGSSGGGVGGRGGSAAALRMFGLASGRRRTGSYDQADFSDED
jgi:hypothetical protein